jgi:hypothetical protein
LSGSGLGGLPCKCRFCCTKKGNAFYPFPLLPAVAGFVKMSHFFIGVAVIILNKQCLLLFGTNFNYFVIMVSINPNALCILADQ